ncbi:phage tail tape measure protein [Pontibacter sp. SGAir0037]|uniref:phage tail tape measure protein n=1 Tax=Pontibacter sp. SGAir0037 TaxID=2571030 RepID=UPI0010CD16D4|nr:phage tail tape measure protein [Pontibacter sp. SGAir0037]QCR23066.1 hypothetical protein C1N53_12410 [Pontibacter sp. SGAir0037]
MAQTEERHIKIIMDGKQVNASLKEMEGAAAVMNNQLKKMSADDPKRKDLLKDFQEMRNRIKSTKDELYGVQKASLASKLGLDGITSASGLMKAGFQAAVAAFLPLLAFQSIVELGRKFLGLVDHIDEVKGKIQQLTGAQGQMLDDMYVRVQAISETFDEEYNDVIKSANVLMKEFGITHEQAFDLIEKGYLSGANASGEMLEQVKEYSTQFAASGASAEEFFAILVKGEKAGIFSDKAADTVKEFGLRIREQTKATGEALDAAFGQGFTDKVFEGINNGSMTTMEALRMVSKEMNNTQVPASELQTVIADVFGGPGEDAGLAFLQSLHEVSGGMDGMIDLTNTLTSAQYDQLEANKELAAAEEELGSAFSGTGATIEWLWTKMKTFGLEIITKWINDFRIMGYEVNGFVASLKSLGGSISDLFSAMMDGNLSGMASAWNNMGTKASNAYYDAYATAAKKDLADLQKMEEQEKAKAEAEAKARALKEAEATRAEKAKQAEKAAKEEERLRKEEESRLAKALEQYKEMKAKAEVEAGKLKIAVMEDGVEKTLASLRFQHEQEIKELDKQRAAVMANIAITEEEKQALLASYAEQEKLRQEELKIAEEEAKVAEREKEREKWFEQLEEDEEYKAAVLEEQFLAAYDAETARETALVELHKQTLEKKLADLRAHGEGETLEALKIKNELLKIEKDKADSAKAIAKERAMFENEMNMLRVSGAGDALDSLMGFMNEESDAYKAFKTIRKAVSVAEVFLNLEKEQALNAATAAANPLNSVTLGAAGAAQLKVMNTLSTIRAVTSIAKIAAFAKGGSTVPMVEVNGAWQMASGYSGGSIGAFADGGMVNNARLGLIGERGAEWVGPNWMLTSPKYAATFSWLEAERQRGGVKAFATGGATAQMPAAPEVVDNSLLLLDALQAINNNLIINNEKIDEWQRELHVIYNAGGASQAMQLREEMERRAGI